jgi:hypothetical protein
VYSSRNTGVATLLRAELPSPTLTTTMSPELNPAADAGAVDATTEAVVALSTSATTPTTALIPRVRMASPL